MSTRAAETVGVVLAGGRSSRMGSDKALLDWQGRPLIEHMIDLLREAGITHLRISGHRPDYAGIPDQRPDAGPVVGLLTVADSLDDGDVLVVPVDMPKLDAALLRRLIDAPAAACVRFADIPLPMRLRLDDETRNALSRVAASDGRERSFRALQQLLNGLSLPVTSVERIALDNCNTPEQWRKVSQR